ncbi:MAG TPA: peptide deformylase [Flavobacteriales bacterium]|nr:peptide deformylase [Flavobacteriales bacterium]|tara:strand:- start:19895 stop:20524 length:630 start_codon:yes stop_codon:yes gene_type:complete
MKTFTWRYFLIAFLGASLLLGCSKHSINSLSTSNLNFSKGEIELIMATDTHSAMRVWKIDAISDSLLLRQKCSDVIFNSSDTVLSSFIKKLHKTVIDSVNQGVGIAAPQVGILKNIIWVQRFDKLNYPFEVYINPTITYYSEEKQPCREGCLSIPNRIDTTQIRSQLIEIKYLDKDGLSRNESVEGFTAVIFQHEIDHLNGILYIDHLD